MVLSAGDRGSPDAERALQTLCETYWYPLYAFARRWGCSPDDAADRTQEFFARLLQQDWLPAADPARGRFRSFLLTVFKRFLAKERERAQAQKRGGDRTFVSIDASLAEQRYGAEPTENWTAETLFERRWALTLLEKVLQQLKTEYHTRGKQDLFERCLPFLTSSSEDTSYAAVAAALQMNEGTVRVAVHRMRQRYRELLQHEVAQTISESDSIDDELESLRQAVRRRTR